jgi:ech hydrogenase subunit D
MSISDDQNFELIPVETLIDRVGKFRQQGSRLVQIGATRLPERVELIYSFELNNHLINLRLHLPTEDPHLPSISSIYGCAILYENELHDLFGIKVKGLTVDFQGNLYKTAVKFPFGSTKAPAPAPKPAAASAAPAAESAAKSPPAAQPPSSLTNSPTH